MEENLPASISIHANRHLKVSIRIEKIVSRNFLKSRMTKRVIISDFIYLIYPSRRTEPEFQQFFSQVSDAPSRASYDPPNEWHLFLNRGV